MTQCTEQAINFLKKANAVMTIELVGCDIPTHWKGETARHNHYKFTITTPKGKMEDDFWDSLYHTEVYNMNLDQMCCKLYRRHKNDCSYSDQKIAMHKLDEAKKKAVPTEYDILACLAKYVPNTFDDFCWEFGYDTDSISALQTYLACQKQWATLCKIFTEEQLEELAEIS